MFAQLDFGKGFDDLEQYSTVDWPSLSMLRNPMATAHPPGSERTRSDEKAAKGKNK